MHGSAKHIQVNLAESEKGTWLLKISDDGTGSSGKDTQPGLGTAVIDSWTRVIDGTKRIESNSLTGYSLEISFANK
jgi:two-component sensor histidine kinase